MINLILNSVIGKVLFGVITIAGVFGIAYGAHLIKKYKYDKEQDKLVESAVKTIEKETLKGGKPNEKQSEDGLDCAITGNPC